MSRSNVSRVNTRLGTRVFYLLLALGQSQITLALSSTGREPATDFNRHTIIHPKVYHARTKREISSTRENDLRHTELLTVGLTVDGVELVLDLKLNNNLIPVGHQQRYQTENGSFRAHEPSAAEVELCQYQGSVRGIPDSWAAVSTCRGLRGVIFDGKTLHYVHPQNDSLESPHYLFKQDDVAIDNTYGYNGNEGHHNHHQKGNKFLRSKRDAEMIRGPYNANKQSRYLELVMVVDKQGYTDLGEDLHRVHEHCKDIANIVNALYRPLNIFIALVGVEVWSHADEITVYSDGVRTLNEFLEYRRKTLIREVPNDNAHLLTTAGTVCRAGEGECDLPEYCTGQSEYCPSDVFKIDGGTCSSAEAFCYQGSCRTRDDQCVLLWGSSGTSADTRCYEMNKKGDRSGDCGYNKLEDQFIECNQTDVLCGRLHCKHLNERLEFGMEAVAMLRTSFVNSNHKILPCRTAVIDLGLNQIDPGLVPNGAKCGERKMCVNQKCVSVPCHNCNGNGVCNSRGNCHCDPGFAPPFCVERGAGGSIDSGPAEVSNGAHVDPSPASSSDDHQSGR